MKPTFVISAGTGWSATTPLWYTLQAANQYLHAGLVKEGEYLPIIAETPAQRLKKRLIQRQRFKAYGEPTSAGVFKFSNRKYNNKGRIPEVDEDLFLTQEEIDTFISRPFSLEKYINYYKRLWETLQENNCPYQAVGDFSNANGWLPEEFCHKLVDRLSEYFDVKALMIVRDPIRRLWSETNAFWTYKEQSMASTEEEHHKLFYDYMSKSNQSQYFRKL